MVWLCVPKSFVSLLPNQACHITEITDSPEESLKKLTNSYKALTLERKSSPNHRIHSYHC